MELNIKQVTNGFILSWKEEEGAFEDDNTLIERSIVIENEEEDNNTCMKKLLEFVAQHFVGYNYDKWGNQNLQITFDGVGHKNE